MRAIKLNCLSYARLSSWLIKILQIRQSGLVEKKKCKKINKFRFPSDECFMQTLFLAILCYMALSEYPLRAKRFQSRAATSSLPCWSEFLPKRIYLINSNLDVTGVAEIVMEIFLWPKNFGMSSAIKFNIFSNLPVFKIQMRKLSNSGKPSIVDEYQSCHDTTPSLLTTLSSWFPQTKIKKTTKSSEHARTHTQQHGRGNAKAYNQPSKKIQKIS